MANFSASDVAMTGFRFVRARPRTVLVWGLLHTVLAVAFGILAVKVAGPGLMHIQELAAQPNADPRRAMETFRQIAPMYGLMIPYLLIYYPVVYAAMSRAVLRPADSAFVYLRLGPDEWRQFLLFLWSVVVFIGVEIAAIIVGAIIGVASVIVAKLVPIHLPGLFLVVPFLVFGAMCFVLVRLSLASALTFDTGRVSLFGSWKITRGRFWKMLGCYLLTSILMLVTMLLLAVIAFAIAAVLGGFGEIKVMFHPDMTSLATYYSPARIAVALLWGFAMAAILPVVMMPPAEIYRRLTA